MVYHENNLVEYVLNVLTFALNLFGCLISIVILIYLIYYQCTNLVKRQERIILLFSVNIYLFLFIFNITQFQLSISSLLGDLYGMNFDSLRCTFNGFFAAVLVCALYYCFIVQVIKII